MRRFLVVALVVGLLGGSLVGPVEAKKKKKKKKGPVAVDQTYFLRNTADSGCAAEALQLLLEAGDAGPNCGSTFSGLVNEVLSRAFGGPCAPATPAGTACGTITYQAGEGLPLVLDASKKITGKIFVMSYRGSSANPGGLTAGPTTFNMTLRGDSGGEEKQIGTFSADYTVTPAQGIYEVPFEIEVDPKLDKATFTTLFVDLFNRGVAPLHGFYQVNTSTIVIPTWKK